jgi:hypothetical protein
MATVVPDMAELFEEAFERAGSEMKSGYDLRTARRSLNLLTLEWQNRGLNLFTVEAGTLALVAGTATYTMPDDTIDLLEHSVRTGTGTSQRDTTLERVSVSTYARQSSKNMMARPSQVFLQRLATSVTVTVWPIPDAAEPYTLSYFRLKGIDGAASGIGGETTAVPPRFVPALVAGLAYMIAVKKPEGAPRAVLLKQAYEEQFTLAAGEDRERASVFLRPGA